MKKLNIFESFEIIYDDFNECHSGAHGHNFYELVFVISGEGTHIINNEPMPYIDDDLFLLSPNDQHYFKILKTTRFLFIHFAKSFIDNICGAKMLADISGINSANQLVTAQNKSMIRHVTSAIIEEYNQPNQLHYQLLEQLLTSLVILIVRALSSKSSTKLSSHTDNKILDILNYIHLHILNPQKNRTSIICTEFDVSPNYFGRYFKRQTGTTLVEYITNCKLKIIENRLLYSEMRINEISRELSFSDVSHFNKFFKKHHGMNPKEFKKIR